MKVFLLIRTERDDLDVVYGIFSSLELAEVASQNSDVFCADIKPVEIDKIYPHEGVI